MPKLWTPNLEKVAALKPEDWGYIAGFFDGEGTVRLDWKPGNYLSCHIVITQKRPAVLRWLHDVFGGHLRFDLRKSVVPSSKQYEYGLWAWHLNGTNAPKFFLPKILPYLRVKKEEVEIAVDVMFGKAQMNKEQIDNKIVELNLLKKVSNAAN